MSKKGHIEAQKQTQFGVRLREIRVAYEWTIYKMSEITGINQKTLSEYERGIRLPARPNMEKIKAAIKNAAADYPDVGYEDEDELDTELYMLETYWEYDSVKASPRRAGQLFRRRA